MMRLCYPVAAAVLSLLSGACSSEGTSEVATHQAAVRGATGSSDGVRATPGFDIHDVIRRSRFAFSRRDDGLVGGDQTYGVHVQGSGAIRFTPIHYPAIASDVVSASSQPSISGRPLELKTTSIFRARELKDNLAAPRQRSSGGVQIEHSRVTELLENTSEGLRQEWLFDAKPPGHGDLRVEVLATGQSYVGETTAGLHFRDEGTGLGTVYGSVKWVDAAGTATELRAEFNAGRIVVTVPEEVLLASAYPALLDPTIGPELQMDVATSGPASGIQNEPDIAVKGAVASDLLIVWGDNRRWLEAGPLEYDIFGARVSSAGTLVDTVGFPISTGPGDQLNPSVVYSSVMDKYAVVWEDRRTYATLFSDVYGTTVDLAGSAGPEIAINVENTNTITPDLAWGNDDVSGGKFLVVWDVQSGTGGVTGQRLDQAFSLFNDHFPVDTTYGPRNNPKVAGSLDADHAFFVAWETTGNVHGRRVPLSGSGAGASPIRDIAITGLAERTPDVAYREQDFFVVWLESATDGFHNVKGSLWRASDGASTTGPVTLSDGNTDKLNLAVATDFNLRGLVSWQDFRSDAAGDLYGARVTLASGAITALDMTGRLLASGTNAQTTPAIQYNNAGSFVVAFRSDQGSVDTNIHATWVDAASGNVTQSLQVSKSANRHTTPAVAFDGTNYLVVFLDRKLDGNLVPDLRATLVSPTGTILVSGITLTLAGGGENPAVVYDGIGNYYVVWMDYRSGTNWDIYGARVRASDGASLDLFANKPIATLSSTQMYPTVSLGGASLLVAWQDYRNGTDYDVWGARVSPSTGAVIAGSEQNISNATGNQTMPRSAFGGTNHLVVWEDTRNANFLKDIYGRFVGATGILGSTIAIANVYENQRLPTVGAFVSEKYVVAWEDDRNLALSATDIYGSRVEAGAAFPNFVISSQTGIDEFGPELAWTGLNYVVVWWQRAVGGTSFAEDVKGQLVTSVGGLSGPVFNVAAQANVRERAPALACNAGTNACLVTYTKYNSVDGTDRIMGTTVSQP